ncbi:GNAT family N-acetyltransferase [Peribacillus glennii]|nr:GNAT family N-acetyltransferase [Peribacillus glennii]
MENLQFVKNYKNVEILRHSFNGLAGEIFGIGFESWYLSGFCTDKYKPFSFADGKRIVANVSVNELDLIMNGESKRAIQIGTVMTHRDYRNQGLSQELINRILTEYKNKHDIMYLFANHSVLDFYPKFGFHAVEETLFTINYDHGDREQGFIRELSGTNQAD